MPGMPDLYLLILAAILAVALLLHIGVSLYRQRLIRRYRRLLYEDDLTGLRKTTYLERYFHDILVSFDRDVSLYYVNIDNFKNYNDLFGHRIANELLKRAAARLHAVCKQHGHVYRVHSDRFLILNPTEEDQEEAFSRRLQHAFRDPVSINGHEIRLTVSVGRYDVADDQSRFYDVLLRSELASHEAKRRGKDRVARYSSELKHVSQDSFEMFQAIREAIEKERFHLEFQPTVSWADGKMRGFEALIRIHDKHRLHFPQDIIGYAERYNMMEEIDRYVVERACKALAHMKSKGVPVDFLSINISSKEIHNLEFLSTIEAALKANGLEAGELIIEFTETNDPEGLEAEATFISNLRALGLKVAIDDFGTGYSSMVRLSRNVIDHIKVDQTFIRDIANNKTNQRLVTSMVKLAESFELSLVIEGVEKRADYEALSDLPIDYAQGYYFYKPLTMQKVIETFADETS